MECNNSILGTELDDLRQVVVILCNNTDVLEAWYDEEEEGRKLLELYCEKYFKK